MIGDRKFLNQLIPINKYKMNIPRHSPVVLFRSFNLETTKEKEICEKYFVTATSRMNITGGDLIVGRYSVLPFYRELESDVKSKGAKLINSYQEHLYIADLKNWAIDYSSNSSLVNLTPKTWLKLEDLPDDVGPVVLKGQTNSRKDRWSTHMFASNKREAIQVFMKLKDDRFFEDQEIYIREFVKFKTFFIDPINKQPITNEFRFFCYKNTVLAGGYYWSSHVDQLDKVPNISCVPSTFLEKVMSIVSKNATFYVIDVAQQENGEWMVIELNDGCMSGLSEVNPDELYKNLKYQLWDKDFKS